MILAMVLFAIGIGMYLWSVWNFGARGRGTPLPLDAPRRLVIHGPYRYTRNPMYVALFSALIGWLTLFPTYRMAIYIVFCLVAVNLFVRAYEEPHLRQVFGVDYEAYMGRVPRWLPRFSRQPDA
jgi:protein-S-isoprenylcysteine O-methyltransferase Ste14